MIRAKIKGKIVEGIDQNNKDGYSLLRQRQERQAGLSDPGKACADERGCRGSIQPSLSRRCLRSSPSAELRPLKNSRSWSTKQAAKAVITAPTVTSGLGFEGHDLFYPWGLENEPARAQLHRRGRDREAAAELRPRHRRPLRMRCGKARHGRSDDRNRSTQERTKYSVTDGHQRTVRGIRPRTRGVHGFVTAYDMHTGKIIWRTPGRTSATRRAARPRGICCSWATTKAKSSRTTRRRERALALRSRRRDPVPPRPSNSAARSMIAVYAGGNADGKIQRKATTSGQFSLNGKGPKGIALGKTPQPKEKIKE